MLCINNVWWGSGDRGHVTWKPLQENAKNFVTKSIKKEVCPIHEL